MAEFTLGTIERTTSASNAMTEQMKRFSLKHRSSSYASGSSRSGPSSATNESRSDASRPSVTDSSRRSSKSSFSSRFKRTKSRTLEETIPEKPRRRSGSLTLGDLFQDLPAEIQTVILSYLSIDDLISLRSSSKQNYAIFKHNAATITRNHFLRTDHDRDSLALRALVELYPSTFSSTTTDAYFLRTLRRKALADRQLIVVVMFIQTRCYMLRLTRELPSERFPPYKAGLTSRLRYPMLLIQYIFDTVRHLTVFSHPAHPSPKVRIDQCPSCMTTLQEVIHSFPQDQLIAIYHVLQLLLLHLRRATDPPSSVTYFERKLKGWGYGPPPDAHISQMIFLGGLHEVSKINEMQGSYSKRIAVVRQFAEEKIAEAVRINSLAFPDFYQTNTDPVMALAGHPPPTNKNSSSRSLSSKQQHQSPAMRREIQRGQHDIRAAIEALADSAPGGATKSLEVRLDLLTKQMIASLPKCDDFLIGPASLLAKRILQLGLVADGEELESPYGFVVRLMRESYEPEVDADELGGGGHADADEGGNVNMPFAQHVNAVYAGGSAV